MREIKAMIRLERLSDVLRALHAMPSLPGVAVSTVKGFGKRYPADYGETMFDEVAMAKLAVVVPAMVAREVVRVVERHRAQGSAHDFASQSER